jgi:hypothetical protein
MPLPTRFGTLSNLDIDASEAVTVIGTEGYTDLTVEFIVGVANLTGFTVEFRPTPVANWMLMSSAALDYTTPKAPVKRASGDLNVAAAGAVVHNLRLDVSNANAVRINAAGANSTMVGNYRKS